MSFLLSSMMSIAIARIAQQPPLVPQDPPGWTLKSWIGLALYLLLFFLALYGIYRIARPLLNERDSSPPQE